MRDGHGGGDELPDGPDDGVDGQHLLGDAVDRFAVPDVSLVEAQVTVLIDSEFVVVLLAGRALCAAWPRRQCDAPGDQAGDP